MYERILVPLDASTVDDAVLDHVSRLALIHNSLVILLRVAHYHTRDSRSHEVEDAELHLKDAAERLKKSGLKVETVLEHGEPADVILKCVEQTRCDLLAMSTHGHKWLYDTLFGSVIDKVRHDVNVPVLLIKGH